MAKSSVISGFYKLPPKERLAIISDFADLTPEETALLQQSCSLPLDVADHMVENVIGIFPNPWASPLTSKSTAKTTLSPWRLRNPASSQRQANAAKMVRDGGGFKTSSTTPVMIGQIQVVKIKDAEAAKKAVLERESRNSKEGKRARPHPKLVWRRRKRPRRQSHRHHHGPNGYCSSLCGLPRRNGRKRSKHHGRSRSTND